MNPVFRKSLFWLGRLIATTASSLLFLIGCSNAPAFIPDKAMPRLDSESAAELRSLEQAVIDRKIERDTALAYLETVREELREHKRSTPEARGGAQLAKLEAREEVQAALVRVKTREMALAIAELEEAKAKILKKKGREGVDVKAFEKRTAAERENLEKERARYVRAEEKKKSLEQGGES